MSSSQFKPCAKAIENRFVQTGKCVENGSKFGLTQGAKSIENGLKEGVTETSKSIGNGLKEGVTRGCQIH